VGLTRRRILLTTKKTLLNSTLPPRSTYSESMVGNAYHGTIVNLTPQGAIVEFFGGVRGYLPVSELSEAYIQNATDHFRVGQTVKTWILTFSRADNRIRLSLKDQTYWEQGGKVAFEQLKEGTLVDVTVSAKLVDKVVVDVHCSEGTVRGCISVDHLVDVPGSKGEKKLSKLREGGKVKEVLVLRKDLVNRMVMCSLKPTLVEAAKEGKLPMKYEDLFARKKVTGYVKNIEDYGAFVGFAGEVEGLVYLKVCFLLHSNLTVRIFQMSPSPIPAQCSRRISLSQQQLSTSTPNSVAPNSP